MFCRLNAVRNSAKYSLNLSEGALQLGAVLRYEGSTPTRQRRKQISKLMRMVVLHTGDGVMMDPGEMANELKEHSRRVAHGGLHDLEAVNEYLRGSPKPRNWRRPPELVLPMIVDVMKKAIRRSAAGDCSAGMDGIGKPLWHALADFLARPMTITMQWQLATAYILGMLDHRIRTHMKNRPPVVANMRPLAMLNERAKIYSTTVLKSIENMMQQLVPPQQVGFLKKWQMMGLVAMWLQRVENTQWGAKRWFFGADLQKAYDKTAHEFVLVGLAEMGVPLAIVRWVARFLGGLTSNLVGNVAIGDPFVLEAGIR